MVSENQGVVGFLGLNEVSLELAASLVKSGYGVRAFETTSPLVDEFSKLGGRRWGNAFDMGKGLAALVILISHDDHIENIIFEHKGVLKGLEKDTTIILHPAQPLVDLQKSEKILTDGYPNHSIIDISVSRAVSDNLNGKLVIISSGRSENTCRAEPILTAMCEKLYTFEGELGAGSKTKLVIELLKGIHLIASIEAISLGTQAGIHPWILYDIISNAAGNSWVFKNYLPQLLRGNQTKHHFLNALIQDVGAVLDKSKSLIFPVPLLTVAYQQLIAGFSHGRKDDKDTTLVKVWEEVYGVSIGDAANAKSYNPEEIAHQISAKSENVKRVGFIGLGAMGFGMATHLLKSNFSVVGFDMQVA